MTMTVPPPSTTVTVVEITVVSIEGLNNYTSFFNPIIKPFVTLTHLSVTHTTKVDDNHKFRVALDPCFFSDFRSCLHLRLFTKRRILGPAHLGSCLIPASDVELLPSGSVGYLSYRLRGGDSSRGHVIINLSVRLEGNATWISSTLDMCHTVIGIPVTAIGGTGKDYCCSSTITNRRKMR